MCWLTLGKLSTMHRLSINRVLIGLSSSVSIDSIDQLSITDALGMHDPNCFKLLWSHDFILFLCKDIFFYNINRALHVL